MHLARRVLLLAALATAFAAAPALAQQTPTTCPATFQVLHDDHIGSFALAAGPYTVTTTGGLTCAAATDLLVQFLEDFDGGLPRGWSLAASTSTFSRGSVSFSLAAAPTPSGGGGGGRFPATGTTCPGTFSVLHDDRIGKFALAQGKYTVTLLTTGVLTCKNASARLRAFLQDPDGALPSPWTLDVATGTFQRSRTAGFRVKPAS